MMLCHFSLNYGEKRMLNVASLVSTGYHMNSCGMSYVCDGENF